MRPATLSIGLFGLGVVAGAGEAVAVAVAFAVVVGPGVLDELHPASATAAAAVTAMIPYRMGPRSVAQLGVMFEADVKVLVIRLRAAGSITIAVWSRSRRSSGGVDSFVGR
jgi:hypothetical protein